ncbi:hypothetical protein A3D00_01065 [Candidatus Woesebacteria bacterium RIFCSPHIGHO2_02_FULL_38_9]|uniref:Enoyl reductase (ER) domain-containing protein n=1 Tax=Candidatus Woesebacteria bacterium RIFCSPHIGHO2_01_FULL_39_28 TaxID=1802496 RepID=A0A1F7YH47_9BACT|nr:MAG: hypothetical protein A2627_01330 [Candidatus Woesebacteria bacterium RIFCSPHIGHO2_01_FULL_39_28]OGM31713.1 MAG: hypothetical protein A3D00_01065 [Candidatus Woesebacteria bacterium RIFCSPHIGHO2_02_FULL_38_9]OGM57654.1 MAG: hypothetical protein A3A50_01440 [Candidatus Woesebacteria bacterium RIFCSPLOWO2_01_FULL_38_20]
MKAIIISRKIQLKEIPDPHLVSTYDVMIKVKATGLCGSDVQRIHKILKREINIHPVLGHEIAGEVIKVGENVKHIKVGDRVAVEPIINCNNCHFCKSGNYQFCLNIKALGKNINGGFAEYIVVPAQNAHKLNPKITYTSGSLLDVISVCVHCMNLAGGFSNKKIAIVGDGSVGMTCMKLALYHKAKSVFLVGKKTLRKRILKHKGSFDLVIEAVGRRNSETLNLAIELVRIKGKVIVLGVYPNGFLLHLNARSLFFKEINLVGSNSYACFKGKKEIKTALKLLNGSKIDFGSIITHTLPLSKFKEGLKLFENKNTSHAKKVIFIP